MKRLAILLLSTAALGGCTSTTRPLPGATDAARAWNDKNAEPCRIAIDLCEDAYFFPPPPEAVTDLRCSGSAAGTATCRFRVRGQRCRARFWRTEDGGWEAKLSGVPRRLLVKCRDLRDS